MFIGHFGVALAAKKVAPRPSPGTLVLAAVLVDGIWPLFVRHLTRRPCFHIIGNMDAKLTVKALGALAQETRLAIYRLLVEHGPVGLAAGRIAEVLELPAATLSFHLKELANAGLVRARQESRFIFYSADFKAMNELVDYLTENCCRASGSCEPAAQCVPKPKPRRAAAGLAARTTRAALTKRRVA